MAFAYGDAVRITAAERTPDYAGKIGIIVGIGADEGDGLSYAVSLSGGGHTASFWESDLTPHTEAEAEGPTR